ncbi:MAG: glycosyltransferase family 4 protein [Deltaproteobacteria bacterium]|jgi:glycosyltransferase involved in cell wall biosynthesis|nr:glycosyltransferase family 4 protein [Deltaproteobacteria bacterium]
MWGRSRVKRIGIVATRLAGTDGVSLESDKWVQVMEDRRLNCYYFAGELDRPPERSYLAEEAHFNHPEIQEIQQACFGVTTRPRSLTKRIQEIKSKLKDDLYSFINQFKIDLLMPENSLTIPMNIPLGLAITELIAETGMPAIAHHHDFSWERDRFSINAVSDYLNMAFPPNLPTLSHTVINSYAEEQLAFRTGISARVIPNIMDFENPPPSPDDYTSDVRQAIGIADDELFVLQPTRVVKRKGIEHAIELVCRLGMKAKLVISHDAGDEGFDYQDRLKEYANFLKVDLILASDIINEKRGRTKDGRKIYTLDDVYPYADLVTYPSTFEGFGNAFLEAIYFSKPIAVNTYSIYTKDIKPKGFSVIELDGYVTQDAVEKTKQILAEPKLCQEMVEHNYELGKRFFSYDVLRRRLDIATIKYPELFGS